MEEFTVYKKSVYVARQDGELEQYRDSKKCNHACAGAIDKAITDHNYDLYHYDLKAAVQTVVTEYGLERVSWVLASTVQQNEYDGRYSNEHKEWANQFTLPDKDTEYYPLRSHPVVLNSFIGQLLELENSLKRIVEYMVQEGTQNTTQGNWIMGFKEFPSKLGGAEFIAAFQGDILHLLEQTEAVADAACVGGSFDVCYYLDYCPNVEMQEPDCPEDVPPAKATERKPSILSQLEEGKKAAAKETGYPQGTPKRDNGREV
ncbi:MAG: DUF3849 domain-containing protein [Oscillospiraceae bacterium]|nr:DUF3849 domain-containing protein [Oscillospiraceae bacterium]